jgi:uncharacterized RDD family membrane protein YckC
VSGELTPGDPLAPGEPASPYGPGPVPPGAFAPRARDDLSNRYADAEPAGWGRRAVAAIIDAAIVSVAAAILLAVSFAPLDLDDASGIAGAILVGLAAVAGITIGALLYAPLVMARTDGRTLGKMATGCRVVRADGRRIDFGWAALREVVVKALGLGVAASLTGGIAYLVDVLWPFFDGRKRALHDIVVDSRVIRS